jgi:hypothetical protein
MFTKIPKLSRDLRWVGFMIQNLTRNQRLCVLGRVPHARCRQGGEGG